MRLIIAFDFPDAKDKKNIKQNLEFYGYEIVKNVYDVSGTKNQMRILVERIQFLAEKNKAKIIFVPVCRNCGKKVFSIGVPMPSKKNYHII